MSKQINCLVVDDEPIARDIILTYCTHLPVLKMVASCSNALEAKQVVEQNEIDLIFLDINMPVLNGLAFLKTLKNPPEVIFTTAYKEYAVDAFDLSAADYLLKPFSLERFIVAVDKVLDKLKPADVSNAGTVETLEAKADDFFFIKTDKKIYKVRHDELLYAEANGNYIKMITTQGNIMAPMTFSSFEELLPRSSFSRIHRSFIINRSRITHLEGNRAFINNHEIPIGSNYKEEFLRSLGI